MGFECGKHDEDDQAQREGRNTRGMKMRPLRIPPNFVRTFGIVHLRICGYPLSNIILVSPSLIPKKMPIPAPNNNPASTNASPILMVCNSLSMCCLLHVPNGRVHRRSLIVYQKYLFSERLTTSPARIPLADSMLRPRCMIIPLAFESL